ncbi:serine/threonine-protein kinase [Nocardioides xinjiangensis]|uniref:serine/threonine-protein kinase n=1 Tax=Nocardioides xinjiangensis TaxID=2817376 RepID=UPI001B30F05C|nr:serine/threonine-protein kinase [Nocardioides sp. SYSU D00778]
MIAGRYRLEREIGRGGAGVVHLAHDEVLGRRVAIKRIGLLAGTTRDDIARAEREARLAAGINHAHVVSIFDLVKDEDCYWLVMEHVEGHSLAELVATEGPLDPRRAAGILAQAADALVQAGTAGIVHRDVKPSNIMVGADDHTKLADFGIARAVGDATLTHTGLVTGSPAYLAPEVASGQPATSASDVWSLGATLYHAVVGEPPYAVGDNVLGGLYKVVHDEPPRLPADHPAAGLLGVMMVKDPGHRWTVRQVRDDLRLIARGRPSTALAASPRGDADDDGTDPGTRTMPVAAAGALPVAAAAAPAAASAAAAPAPPPAPSRDTTPPPEPARSRRLPLGWVAAVLALVLVAGIGAWLLWPGDGERPAGGTGDAASEQSSPSGEPTESEDPTATTEPSETEEPTEEPTEPTEEPTTTSPPATGATAASMQAFVRDYFATVTSDPETTFAMLTPEFQADSGGYGRYAGFWSTITSATPSGIRADPRTMTVSYTIVFETTDGRTSTEQGRLQLAQDGDRYLIADEG